MLHMDALEHLCECNGKTEGGAPPAITVSAGLQSFPAPKWAAEEAAVGPRRNALPEPQEDPKPYRIWEVVKGLVGSDLLDAPLPIGQYCPLTTLHFRCAELEYTRLLDQAALFPKGSTDRLLMVAAFAQSGGAAALKTHKCLNSVMGETFELVRPEQGMRCIMESVHQEYSHGSRFINAWHAEGAQWELSGEDEPKVNFRGSYIDINLNWTTHLTFYDGETFAWRKGPSHLSGLMSGSLTVTHKGHTDVHAHATGLAMRLAVKEPGMFSGKGCKHEITGHLVDGGGRKVAGPTISGNYDGVVTAHLEDGSQRVLWELHRTPDASGSRSYGFSEWDASLNELTPGQSKGLPRTDARFRPDLRALEEGRYTEAEYLKKDLTERMRQKVIDAQRGGKPLQPRWFELKSHSCLTPTVVTGIEQRYRFKGEYWEARNSGKWEGVPDIFEMQPHEE